MKARYLRPAMVIGVIGLLGWINSAFGTPMYDKENKGVIEWPNNTTITVYVPDDPDGLGREASVKAGIKSWGDSQTLKDKGIKIDVQSGTPPAGATNAVSVQWVAGKIDSHYGLGGPSYATDGKNTTNGGSIQISRDTDQVTSQMAKNLGIHEMGHVLGLDDTSKAGAAMNPGFTKADSLTITSSDEGELKAVYTANATDTQTNIHASVAKSGDLYKYIYDLTWLGGGQLGLFQIDTAGSPIMAWTVPTGWALDPIGLDGDVMSDVQRNGVSEQFVSFVIGDETTYLSQDNPFLSFSITTATAPSIGEVFLNGRSELPTPTPEPTGLSLVAIGMLALSYARSSKGKQ